MQIILVPIDNRPVTYVFPQLIAKIAGVNAILPPRQIMGSLSSATVVEVLNDWLNTTLKTSRAEALLVCLDSIIYGGLIPSRRTDATVGQVMDRTKVILRWKKDNPSLGKIYAQSSIMRISDNYDNTEEKTYWSRFGREIYSWSEALHRLSSSENEADRLRAGELEHLEARIEDAIRKDYLDTRWRNFQVNRKLLDYVRGANLDFLIYSQDDSGQFGLNVMERDRLLDEATKRKITNVIAYAGADEVLMTMLARFLISQSAKPSIKISFSPEAGAGIASRYEGQSIGESVRKQLGAAGLPDTTSDKPELHFVIHTSGDRQGDHILLPGHPDMRNMNTAAAVQETIKLIDESTVPVVLCDVAYSNGADPMLMDELFAKPERLRKLWGYGGWNTTGNTLGSAIAMGVARWYAQQTGSAAAADEALKTALFVRLADDWAYQVNVRKELTNNLSVENLKQLMSPYLGKIEQALDHKPGAVELSLPWQRSFEVEVHVADSLQPAR